jgi:PAS domain S-box-containing protein
MPHIDRQPVGRWTLSATVVLVLGVAGVALLSDDHAAVAAVAALALALPFAAAVDRRAALAGLARSEERLRRIITEMPVMFDAFHADGTVAFWNRECERVTGWTAAEIVDHPLALERLYPDPEYRARMLAQWSERREDYLAWEWTLTAKDGTSRTIAWSNIAASVPVSGWATWGIGVDVTALREAERRLRERTRDLESVLQTVPIGVWFTDTDDPRVLHGNPHAAEQLGLPLAANHALDRLHGAKVQVRLNGRALAGDDLPAQAAALRGESVDRVTYELVWADGRRQWLMCSARPIVGENGVRRGICAAVDVTESVLAERALAESEAEFRTLADSLPQIVWAATPEGTVDWYNRRWHERVGRPTSGAEWLAHVHPDDRERCVERWTAAVATGAPFESELRLQFPGQPEPRWHLARAVPVRDGTGAITRWLGTSTDIQDLRSAQDVLRSADRRKDEMVATIAHELRGPLGPVRYAAAILGRAQVGAAEQARCREIIVRQTQQMALLLDDLLDTAQVARGALVLRRSHVDLATVVEGAVENARPRLDARHHTLTVDLPASPIVVHADPLRLTQVLSNLLTNAAKYTDPGGTVRLTVERHADAVRIDVADDGIGLSSEALGRVFEMFSQESAARARADGGLGIGLSLVRGLVELHGGRVEAASDGPGRGSTFTVTLPIDAAPATAANDAFADGRTSVAVERAATSSDHSRSATWLDG